MVPRGEQGTRDGNREKSGDGSEDVYGNYHAGRDGTENGSGDGNDNREEGRGEREPEDLRKVVIEVGRKTREVG